MSALNKIALTSPSRQNPTEIETSIAGALYDLETNIPDMRSALRPLQFVSAREVRTFEWFFFWTSLWRVWQNLRASRQIWGIGTRSLVLSL
jgi:hypothetical protein